MGQTPYVFNQLCALLPRDYFEYLVRTNDGNTHVKSYSCWNHYLVMLWAQLTSRESLRDIEASLRAHGDKLYRMGMGRSVSRNTIAHANATRPVAIYREFASKVMALALERTGKGNAGLSSISGVLHLAGMFAVDSSTVSLDLQKFGWAVPQQGAGGVKLHTMYDMLRLVPAFCLVTGHEERDQTFMDDYPYKEQSLYVFDKAYVKTASLKRLNDLPAFFIVRRKRKMEYAVLVEHPVQGAPVYGDKEIVFANRWAKNGYPDKLRLVQYYSRERNELMEFLTNCFALPAGAVAEVYRNRWSVELFFRWLKQNLRIAQFYGTSANAVLIQIYVAVTAYCLVAMAAYAYRFKGTLYEFLRILSVSLPERRPLAELLRCYEKAGERRGEVVPCPSLFQNEF